MRLINLANHVSVSDQIEVSEVSEIAEMGFQILINNRPDLESADQPQSAQIEETALKYGLDYYYFPVTGINFPGDNLGKMGSLFSDPSRKTLAFCRSGTRSANLWLSTLDTDVALDLAREVARLGIDPSMFLSLMQRDRQT